MTLPKDSGDRAARKEEAMLESSERGGQEQQQEPRDLKVYGDSNPHQALDSQEAQPDDEARQHGQPDSEL